MFKGGGLSNGINLSTGLLYRGLTDTSLRDKEERGSVLARPINIPIRQKNSYRILEKGLLTPSLKSLIVRAKSKVLSDNQSVIKNKVLLVRIKLYFCGKLFVLL